MRRSERNWPLLAAAMIAMMILPAASAATSSLLLSGLAGASGSAIGPGGALYVTEGALGRLSRVDRNTGAITTVASGLPAAIIPIGGPMDVAFIGSTAYVLVSLVGSDLGGSHVNGIYRVDGPNSFTIIADIGTWSAANPPQTPFDLAMGLQYAIEPFRGGFLVTDGHHNRVLWVTLDGRITELITFGNIVPTGLALSGNTVYVSQAGPVPHLPADGKVVVFEANSAAVTQVAAGAPLLVDVEFGRGRDLFALSQGSWAGASPGDPATPNTGALVKVNANGTFSTVIGGLNLPTSLEIVGDTAYVVTLTGDIWKVDGISGPPYGTH
jgi:hypothetical protein